MSLIREELRPAFVDNEERRDDFGRGVGGVLGGEASVLSCDGNECVVARVLGRASTISVELGPKSGSRLGWSAMRVPRVCLVHTMVKAKNTTRSSTEVPQSANQATSMFSAGC